MVGACISVETMRVAVLLAVTVCTLVGATTRNTLYDIPLQKLQDWPQCKSDMESIAEGLGKRQFWAFQMLDASTKIPNGVLTGSLIDYGNYDECLLVRSPDAGFQGQHCMATISVPINSSQLNLMWSYCIPSSCPPAALQQILTDYLPSLIPFNTSSSVSESDCNIQESNPLAWDSILGIVICLLFGVAAVVSTAYDVLAVNSASASPVNAWFRAFSLYTNGKKLLSVSPSGAGDNLAPLHGMRFFSICWVVLGHRYFFTYTSSIMNATDVLQVLNRLEFQLIAGAVLSVDTFFFMSGLLNAFHSLKVLEDTRSFPVVKYYVHRYLRTTPALAVMVLVYASWFTLLGDGPAWSRTTEPWKDLCQQYWWPTLLYINNYYNPVTQCAGQSWYLAVDMQLYWISPLIILPIWMWPRVKNYYLGLLLVASTVAQFVVAYVEEIRMPFSISQDLEEYKRVTQLIYVPTHTRASPYIIGIMLGCYLHEKRGSGCPATFSKKTALLLWMASAALCLAVILGNFPFFAESQFAYDRLASSFYISLHRIAWTLGVGWVVVACLCGRGGVVNRLLSWRALVPFSRLTYCIFLVHMAVQQYQLGTARTTDYFQNFSLVHRFLGDLVVAVGLAALLSLLFESPVMVLEKLLMRKPERGRITAEGSGNPGFVKEEK